MRLEHYHNNAYDTIVLTYGGTIVGAWSTPEAVEDFYGTIGEEPANDWMQNDSEWAPSIGVDTLVATIKDDGELVCHDEALMAARRKFFKC